MISAQTRESVLDCSLQTLTLPLRTRAHQAVYVGDGGKPSLVHHVLHDALDAAFVARCHLEGDVLGTVVTVATADGLHHRLELLDVLVVPKHAVVVERHHAQRVHRGGCQFRLQRDSDAQAVRERKLSAQSMAKAYRPPSSHRCVAGRMGGLPGRRYLQDGIWAVRHLGELTCSSSQE